MKDYKTWSDDEIALIRASIKNNAEDMDYLMKALGRTEGSIACRLGRERMDMGLKSNYTGETIGNNGKGPVTV